VSRLEGPRGSSLYGTHHPTRKGPIQTCCTSAGARESPALLKHGSGEQIHRHYEPRIETTESLSGFQKEEMGHSCLYAGEVSATKLEEDLVTHFGSNVDDDTFRNTREEGLASLS
jgi:hypothetical protein